jgi:hypothetical protein
MGHFDFVQFCSCFSHAYSIARGLTSARKCHFHQGQQAPEDSVFVSQICSSSTLLVFFKEMSIDHAKYLIRKACLAEADDAESIAKKRISWPFPRQHLHQDYTEAVHISTSRQETASSIF